MRTSTPPAPAPDAARSPTCRTEQGQAPSPVAPLLSPRGSQSRQSQPVGAASLPARLWLLSTLTTSFPKDHAAAHGRGHNRAGNTRGRAQAGPETHQQTRGGAVLEDVGSENCVLRAQAGAGLTAVPPLRPPGPRTARLMGLPVLPRATAAAVGTRAPPPVLGPQGHLAEGACRTRIGNSCLVSQHGPLMLGSPARVSQAQRSPQAPPPLCTHRARGSGGWSGALSRRGSPASMPATQLPPPGG